MGYLPFLAKQQTLAQGCDILPRRLNRADGVSSSRMGPERRQYDMSLFKMNSDDQLANELLLGFLLNLDFASHLIFEQSHKIVEPT